VVIPETHRDLLTKPILAHCATIGPRGEPQANPIWFLWEREQIVFSIDIAGQKGKNLERDPRIALSMVDPDNPAHYLEVRGIAAYDRQATSQDPTIVALVRKYTGNDTYPGQPDDHWLFLVEPLRTTTMG
jgi:PPOX class probable F420-dependent enzyme